MGYKAYNPKKVVESLLDDIAQINYDKNYDDLDFTKRHAIDKTVIKLVDSLHKKAMLKN